MADFLESSPKRMRLAYHHKHKLHYRPQELPEHEPAVLDTEANANLLIRGVKNICEEVACNLDIDEPTIESVALEALRNAAEDFMLEVCTKVRRSMQAARRVAPIAPDFESALATLNLPVPEDQIRLYKTRPDINPSLLPTPPPDDLFHNHTELPSSFLGPELSKQDDLKQFAFKPAFLPPLPSAHTYKDSPVFTVRETDTRKIRELATEEGKLGEQALRKLATAVKLDAAISAEPKSRIIRGMRGPRRRHTALSEEAVFEETMRDLLSHESGDFELGPIVTSEKNYRMPDDARMKRRPVTAKQIVDLSTLGGGGVSSLGKYNLLPPPLKKQSMSKPSDSMEIDP